MDAVTEQFFASCFAATLDLVAVERLAVAPYVRRAVIIANDANRKAARRGENGFRLSTHQLIV